MSYETLPSGTVTGRVSGIMDDASAVRSVFEYDEDGNITGSTNESIPRDGSPDAFALSGTVTFSPSVRDLVYSGDGEPAMLHLEDVTATIDAGGRLCGRDGAPDVVLLATDAEGVSPTGWVWQVTFGTADPDRPGFAFALPTGSSVDLAIAGQQQATDAKPQYAVIDSTVAQAAAKSAADAKAWAEQAKSIANLTDASTTASGLMSAADKAKLDGIEAGANAYTLVPATATGLGGVIVGDGLSVESDGTLSATATLDSLGAASAGDVEALGTDVAALQDEVTSAVNRQNLTAVDVAALQERADSDEQSIARLQTQVESLGYQLPVWYYAETPDEATVKSEHAAPCLVVVRGGATYLVE